MLKKCYIKLCMLQNGSLCGTNGGKIFHVNKTTILMDFNLFFCHKFIHQCSREYLSFGSSPVVFNRVRVAQSLVFCVGFCGSFLSFSIAYPFSIFKLFVKHIGRFIYVSSRDVPLLTLIVWPYGTTGSIMPCIHVLSLSIFAAIYLS